MADRFENGSAANDTGGIQGGPNEHGFDPMNKGSYQGGDLNGQALVSGPQAEVAAAQEGFVCSWPLPDAGLSGSDIHAVANVRWHAKRRGMPPGVRCC